MDLFIWLLLLLAGIIIWRNMKTQEGQETNSTATVAGSCPAESPVNGKGDVQKEIEKMNELFNVDAELLAGLNNFFGNLFRAAKDSYSLSEYNEQRRFYKEVISKLIMNGLKHNDNGEENKKWELNGYQMGHQYPEKMNQLHQDLLCSRLTVAQQLEAQLQVKVKQQEREKVEQERRIQELSEELERSRDVGFVLGEIISKVDINPLMECAVCFRPYSKTIIPYVGECGHSICKRCTNWIKKTDCPVCRDKSSFDAPIRNYLATELMSLYRNENPHALIDRDPFEDQRPEYENQQVGETEDEDDAEIIMAADQERLWAQILAENAARARREAQLAEERARPRTVEEDVAQLVRHLVDIVEDDEDVEQEEIRQEAEREEGTPAVDEEKEADENLAPEDGQPREMANKPEELSGQQLPELVETVPS